MSKSDDNRRRIMEYIRERLLSGDPSPTVREIQHELGFKSTSTVHLYLKQLEESGAISKSPRQNRTIRLQSGGTVQVPLLGTVRAGQPILAVEEVEGYVPYQGKASKGQELFALRVRGDSMIEAGILEGDILIVRQQPAVENGEIVVALMEEEATVKRFFREKERIRLQPENREMEPIYVREKDCRILGKVIALHRHYQ